MSDIYDDVELPWPDVKVASMLCLGGPCRYMLGSEVDSQFVLTHVVPHIHKRLNDETSLILGTALLYSICCIDDTTNNVPSSIASRVRNALNQAGIDPTEAVKRIPVVCTGHEGEIYIDDIIPKQQLQGQGSTQDNQGQEGSTQDNQGFTNRNQHGNLTDRPLRDQLRAMQSQLQAVKSSVIELEKKIEANHQNEMRYMRSLSANMKRFSTAPARPILRSGTIVSATANLSSCPRTLYELWDEYTVGIGGSKPAKDYTAQERGKCKYKYYRRKIVWDLIARLTGSGLESHVIIDRIYQHYGRKCSVTDIVKLVREDSKRNYIPPILRL